MKKLSLLVFLVLFSCLVHAQQTVYAVYLKDKAGVAFDPYTFFNEKAIERRIMQHFPLTDTADFPLNEQYVKQVSGLVTEIKACSRWLNAVFVQASVQQAEELKKLSCVDRIETINAVPSYTAAVTSEEETEESDLSEKRLTLLRYQTRRLQGNLFRDKNIDGKGMRIAVFDAGFPGVDKLPYFKHLRDGNRILKTYDFVKKKEFVYAYYSHGTSTLSCIAGKYKDENIGMATGAEFLLARTEKALSEPLAEEYYWLAAAEWADQQGANIISSSLGYGKNRYVVKDMNGHNSIAANAATMAAKRGILVVNSAGNEYTDEWRFIITPADADSVLCVGGTSPYSDMHIDFSSMGPTADMRMKPNVSAPGNVIASGPHGMVNTQGTSFSCPLVSGFAACAWQMNRSFTNMQLFKAIEQSGHLYPYFDYVHGFGIPQASFFTGKEGSKPTTFEVIRLDEGHYKLKFDPKYTVRLKDTCDDFRQVRASDKEAGQFNLYYNVQAPDRTLRLYRVILVTCKKEIQIFLKQEEYKKGDKLNIHFEGNTQTLVIE